MMSLVTLKPVEIYVYFESRLEGYIKYSASNDNYVYIELGSMIGEKPRYTTDTLEEMEDLLND